MMRRMMYGVLVWVLLVVGGCCTAGDNPYYCLASPSDFAVDAADGRGDVSFEVGADQPMADERPATDVLDVDTGVDDVVDAAMPPEDTGTEDVADVLDAPDVIPVVDVVDVPAPSDVVDVVTVDQVDAGGTDVRDVATVDMPDVPMGMDVGADVPPLDTGTDVPMIDVPVVVDVPAPIDRVDVVDVVDVPVVIDMPDVPPPPDLVIEYNSNGSVPSGGLLSQLSYAYQGTGAPWPRCTAIRLGSTWRFRCTIELTPVASRSARFILLTVPGACGQEGGFDCPANWQESFVVVWHGRTYVASDLIATEAGTVPAIQLRSRTYCGPLGYNAGCVEFTVP